MINSEAIFTVIFIAVILAIPFGIGMNLSRALRKRKEITKLIIETRPSSGRVVGYTKRRYDSENIGNYYPIIEYETEEGQIFWAEGSSCDTCDYSINSIIEFLAHPRDRRYVKSGISHNVLRAGMSFGKNFEVSINIIFTVCVVAWVIYSKLFSSAQIMLLALSYTFGLIVGFIFNAQKSEEKLRVRISENRNKRLVAAQEKYLIPCYLEE